MQKHAYLIMAHNNFPLLLELIKMLDHERHTIYLHIDKKVPETDFLKLQSDYAAMKTKLGLRSPLIYTQRISVHWGGYSQIACELLLLNAAARDDQYMYYHLLSGSDLPIKSPEEILAFFDALSFKHGGLPEFLAMDAPTVPSYVRERISLYHIFRESSHPLAEPLDTIFTRLQRIFRVDRLKQQSLVLQKGANWFSITDAFVRYTLSHEEWIAKTFRHSVCADELFLQTLAANSDFSKRIFEPYGNAGSMTNLRYVDWERGANNNPYVFGPEDKALLLSLPHLFARKFQENIFQ